MDVFKPGYLCIIFPFGLRYVPTMRVGGPPRSRQPWPPPQMSGHRLVAGVALPGTGIYRRKDGSYYQLGLVSACELPATQVDSRISALGSVAQRLAHAAGLT